MGFVFRGGFLCLLHLEIVHDSLREFIRPDHHCPVSLPHHRQHPARCIEVANPTKFPDPSTIKQNRRARYRRQRAHPEEYWRHF